MRAEEIDNKDLYSISLVFPGNLYVSSNTNLGIAFCADRPIEIIKILVSYNAKDTNGATINFEKLLSTVAISSGINIYSFDLTTTTGQKTIWTKTRTDFDQTLSSDGLLPYQLKEGDRLGFFSANTGDTIRNLNATIYYKISNKGDYR